MSDELTVTPPSTKYSIVPSTASSSADGKQRTKTGRPNKWTASRSRKLARLYLYSMLPPKDIPEALRDNDWVPGKESTIKTVNTLLDNQPRWLRPKNQEQMDQRIAGLSECKAKRKNKRKLSQPEDHMDSRARASKAMPSIGVTEIPADDLPTSAHEEYRDNRHQASEAIPSITFTETPLDDLLAFVPEERFSSNASYLNLTRNSVRFAIATSSQGIPYQDEQVLPPSTWQDSSIFEQTFAPTSPHASVEPAVDQRSLSTYISTSSLERRLPQYSAQYLKCINRLLESFSLSGASAPTVTQSASSMSLDEQGHSSESCHTVLALPGIKNASRNATLLLPDAFMRIDQYMRRQGLCIPGLRPHDSRSCWCAVEEEMLSQSKFWVGEAGLVMCVTDPPKSLQSLDLDFIDSFGNNVLHLLAVRGAHFHVILQAMEQVDDVNAKNTASQSFLHVLRDGFLRCLVEDQINLIDVLQHLNRFKVRFLDCDVFGRSFFHILTHLADNLILRENVIKALYSLNAGLTSARDAFGWTPALGGYNREFLALPGQDISPWPARPEGVGCASGGDVNADAELISIDEALILKHARLLETARLAFTSPSIEDSEGRNGLHCLAEASLGLSISDNTVQPTTSQRKRKRDRDHLQIVHTFSAPLTLRYELVQDMLLAGVDVNTYDCHSNTVLMAFVIHLCDGEDDKVLAKLLHFLIQRGANVHQRNRHGETALHIAVRLGRKIATRVLLENGSNVHARTIEGKGVLAVGEAHYLRARDNQQLYASIMACMALAIQFGAVAAPTLVQEWSTPCVANQSDVLDGIT